MYFTDKQEIKCDQTFKVNEGKLQFKRNGIDSEVQIGTNNGPYTKVKIKQGTVKG